VVTEFSEVLARLADSLARTDFSARRVFHGRGGCYPGLEFMTLDDFGSGLWLVLFKEPEVDGWAEFLAQLQTLAVSGRQFCLIQHRYRKPVDSHLLWGDVPDDLSVCEEGLRYKLALQGRQNTGYFMDAAPARTWLKERVEGRSVLNLFAYTCAFSVAAIDGGADSVVNVDMSKAALNTGRENHRLNAQALSGVMFLGYDIFRSWKRIRQLGPYGCIVIDPPSFQRGSFDARKDYARVLRCLPELASDGADMLLCLNAPYLDIGFLLALLAEHLPSVEVIGLLGARPDFPELSPALKMLHVRYAQPSDVAPENG
jgi:23S rRNA (cytosine1962-C5)-methyltransferase